MDLKTLKLELLERIADLDDEARLLALKRLLDAPRGYGVPNEELSVVREGEASYLKLEDRMYSAEEVRALVLDALGAASSEVDISDAELAELDRRHAARLSGESKGLPWKTSMDRLRAKD